jgi:ABC-2 type transport system ATP-binding protein
LRKVGLDPNSSKSVGEFSQGMKKRLGIAQAMIGEPECLLLDEPTALLDQESVKAIHQLFQDFSQHGGTIFFTSSNMEECEKICDRIAILENGRIGREITATELNDPNRAIKVRIRTGPINKEWLQVLRRRISQECHATMKIDEQGLEVRIWDENMIPSLLHVLHDEKVPVFEVHRINSTDSFYFH